jgi:hypothetical protein
MKYSRKTIKQLLLIYIFSIIACGGCAPYNFTHKPGISGTVIDSSTKKPINNANITLKTRSFPGRIEKTENASTHDDGSFFIAAEQEWSVYIVPLDPYQMKGEISVEAEGYKKYLKEFYVTTMGPAITEFKDILMERFQ